jgi:hypothetical protein
VEDAGGGKRCTLSTLQRRIDGIALVGSDAHGSIAIVASTGRIVGDNKEMRTLRVMVGTPSSQREIADLSGHHTEVMAAPTRKRGELGCVECCS